MEDLNEGDEHSRLLNLLSDGSVKRVTKEEVKSAKCKHTVKMMLSKEHHQKVLNWTKANVA